MPWTTLALLEAVRRMGVRGAAAIPVVDRADSTILRLVSRAHVLALYERRLAGAVMG